MILGKKLRRARIVAGLTQNEIAKKLGHKNSTYICNVEAGRKNPKLYNLAKLCKYYDVELGEFILFPQ